MTDGPKFMPAPETERAAKRLGRYVGWSRGFWLGYVFTISPPQAHILQDRLRERGAELRILRPQTPVELASLIDDILGAKYEGCTWIEAIRNSSTAASYDALTWQDGWAQFTLRLNERREAARELLVGGLVLAAHPSIKPIVRVAGPDLWSIRSFVFELPAGPQGPGVREQSGLLESENASRQRGAPPDSELLDQEARLLQQLQRDPSSMQDPEGHVRALLQLGQRLDAAGRWDQALEATREAVVVCRQFADEQPDVFLPKLAEALDSLGLVLSELGRREEALAATEEAVHIRRELVEARPDAFLPGLAGALNNLGNRLSELGRREEALAATEEAVTVYRELAEARPDASFPDLAGALNNLGNRLNDLGRREEALAAADEAVTVYRELADARPDAFLPDLAMALTNFGNRLGKLGRREEALAATDEAVRIRRELAKARPDAFRPHLAGALNSHGTMLNDLGRREEALPVTEEAVTMYRELAESRPDAFLPDLARALNNLGNRLGALGRREEALTATDEAVQVHRELAKARLDAFRPELAGALNNLGIRLSELGREADALAATEEAVSVYRELAKARPDAFLPGLAMSLATLGVAQRDQPELSAKTFAEGLRLLIPLFEQYERAFAPLLESMVAGLAETCRAGQLEIPEDLQPLVEARLSALSQDQQTD
jgi:tetratricopeptide (TPR) repeat protein